MTRPRIALPLLLLLGSCAITQTLPEQWSSPVEAFPDKASMIPPKGAKGASATATFQAPYEDVYRAALVSASQVMFDVTKDDKRAGYVLAERIAKVGPDQVEWHFYYAIRIDELRAKSTRVTVAVKGQRRCVTGTGTAAVLTLGISAAAESGTGEKQKCLAESQVHWTDEARSDTSQLMIFIRNNLISAGLY